MRLIILIKKNILFPGIRQPLFFGIRVLSCFYSGYLKFAESILRKFLCFSESWRSAGRLERRQRSNSEGLTILQRKERQLFSHLSKLPFSGRRQFAKLSYVTVSRKRQKCQHCFCTLFHLKLYSRAGKLIN